MEQNINFLEDYAHQHPQFTCYSKELDASHDTKIYKRAPEIRVVFREPSLTFSGPLHQKNTEAPECQLTPI
jgi:hypothetical protein